MSVSYTCPNPECGVTLKTPSRVQVGKSVKCPKCSRPFVPELGAEKEKEKREQDRKAKEVESLKLAEEKAGTQSEPSKTEAPAKKFVDDDEDEESVKKGYGVAEETEEEKAKAEENRPTFGAIKDKFKKSARGPAMSLLVMPSNLLTLAGLLTCVCGLGFFLVGMWPLVFNDAPPGEEELEDAIVYMILGVFILFWGATVCFGASQMQELASYPFALIGSIMGIFPFLVGIFGLVMIHNPKVQAGFQEGDAFDEDEDKDDDDDDDDDDDEEEDDDDDDEEEDAKKKRSGKKLATKAGKGSSKKDEDE
jgi:hypothetical protein